MILTCPSCTMRYLVAEGAIGLSGRKVRCAHCGQEWWQDPEEGLDEALFGSGDELEVEQEIEIDFDDIEDDLREEGDFQSILQKEIETVEIPQGVRPVVHEDLVLPVKTKKSIKLPPMEKLGGFAVAGIFYLFVIGALLLMQPQISRAWPPSNMLYTMIGMKPSIPGEGLTLDNLEAKMEDGKILLTGDINNLKSAEQKIPAIMASIVDEDEKVIDRVLIAPPAKTLNGESHVAFDVVYPSVPETAKNVTFAFSFLKAEAPKIAKPEEPVKEGAHEDEPVAEEKPAPATPAEHKPDEHH